MNDDFLRLYGDGPEAGGSEAGGEEIFPADLADDGEETGEPLTVQQLLGTRLFTVPAEDRKYYGAERQDCWHGDSEEISAVIRFFRYYSKNITDDPDFYGLVSDAFLRLNGEDDEALAEVTGFALLVYADEHALRAIFDGESGFSAEKRYVLAIAGGAGSDLPAEKKDVIFNAVRNSCRAALKKYPVDSDELFSEIVIADALEDGRLIPVMRRYANALRDYIGNASVPSDEAGRLRLDELSSNYGLIRQDIRKLGGDAGEEMFAGRG